jgi:hypothetical protein
MMLDTLTHQIKTLQARCSLNHWSLVIWNHDKYTNWVHPLIILQHKKQTLCRRKRKKAQEEEEKKKKSYPKRSEVLMVAVMKIQFFLDRTSYWSPDGIKIHQHVWTNHPTTQCNNPEDLNLQQYAYENFKSGIQFQLFGSWSCIVTQICQYQSSNNCTFTLLSILSLFTWTARTETKCLFFLLWAGFLLCSSNQNTDDFHTDPLFLQATYPCCSQFKCMYTITAIKMTTPYSRWPVSALYLSQHQTRQGLKDIKEITQRTTT